MKGLVIISIDVYGNKATIDLTIVRARVKKWLVEDLLDTFEVDDAVYNTEDKLIHVQNWDENNIIDKDELKQTLYELLRQRVTDHDIVIV